MSDPAIATAPDDQQKGRAPSASRGAIVLLNPFEVRLRDFLLGDVAHANVRHFEQSPDESGNQAGQLLRDVSSRRVGA